MSVAVPVSEVEDVARRAESWTPQEILDWALDRFHPRIAFASSFGVEDVAVIHMLSQLNKDARVFTLDTGRLPAETYDVMERIRDAYGTKIEVFFPQREAAEQLQNERGFFSFRRSVEDRKLCCGIRKVEPLNRSLSHPGRLDHRPAPRAGGDAHDPARGRDRPRPRRHREGEPAREVDGGPDLGLRARAQGPLQRAARPGLSEPGLRALHARDQARRGRPRRPLVVGEPGNEGVRTAQGVGRTRGHVERGGAAKQRRARGGFQGGSRTPIGMTRECPP